MCTTCLYTNAYIDMYGHAKFTMVASASAYKQTNARGFRQERSARAKRPPKEYVESVKWSMHTFMYTCLCTYKYAHILLCTHVCDIAPADLVVDMRHLRS